MNSTQQKLLRETLDSIARSIEASLESNYSPEERTVIDQSKLLDDQVRKIHAKHYERTVAARTAIQNKKREILLKASFGDSAASVLQLIEEFSSWTPGGSK